MAKSVLKQSSDLLIPNCLVADSFFSRFLGLMGRKAIAEDEAIVFPKCNSIHTFFMRFPIDVILVSSEGKVVEVLKSLGPWRMLLPRRKAKHVIEMKAGLSDRLGISVGSQLDCRGAWE